MQPLTTVALVDISQHLPQGHEGRRRVQDNRVAGGYNTAMSCSSGCWPDTSALAASSWQAYLVRCVRVAALAGNIDNDQHLAAHVRERNEEI